jgi:glycerophosphoryl diester phosphodiesterase
MLKNWPNPMVFAHRGASVKAPENTIASFQLAKTLNADAVEFDVKLTSDRQVVVIHDATVDRTTNGTGKVSDLSLAEIKHLDAGAKFNEIYDGERIPTLREVFETFGDQLRFNIELTNYKTPLDGLIYEVKKLIDEFKLKESIIFSSFNPMNLSLARNLMPEIDCGLLTFPGTLGKLSMLLTNKKSYQAVHPNVADVNEKLVSTIHSQGKRVHVWTVNDKEKMKELLGLGVDGIFTDNPEELKSLLEFHE